MAARYISKDDTPPHMPNRVAILKKRVVDFLHRVSGGRVAQVSSFYLPLDFCRETNKMCTSKLDAMMYVKAKVHKGL